MNDFFHTCAIQCGTIFSIDPFLSCSNFIIHLLDPPDSQKYSLHCNWPFTYFYPKSWVMLSHVTLSNYVLHGVLFGFYTFLLWSPFSIPIDHRPVVDKNLAVYHHHLFDSITQQSSPPISTACRLHLDNQAPSFTNSLHQSWLSLLSDSILSDIPVDDDPPTDCLSTRFSSNTLRLASDPIPSTVYRLNTSVPLDTTFVAALQSEFHPGSSNFPILLDTGCSFAMTFDCSDFEGDPIYDDWGTVQTASTQMPLTAFGRISWDVGGEDGSSLTLRMPGFLVPGSNLRLISPQDYARHHRLPVTNDNFGGCSTSMWLLHADGTHRVRANMEPSSNLPFLIGRPSKSPSESSCGCHATAVHSPLNINLSSAQKALLLDHERLGHLSFRRVQQLYRPSSCSVRSEVSSTLCDPCFNGRPSGCSSCDPPLCLACSISKAKRRSRPGKTGASTDPSVSGSLRTSDFLPGDRISMDHYDSSVSGRLPFTKGQEPGHTQYRGGTIFVDHASGFVFTGHQVTLAASDTIRSKDLFEACLKDHGVRTVSYHCDNGVFTSAEFTSHLRDQETGYRLSGVGAHHQNGIAERAIQTVVWNARTMLSHAHLRWPDHFHSNLWPFAMTYATWLYNHTPNEDGFAPIELLTGVLLGCHHLRRSRVWGCPGYVLDPRLQDGKKIPKWEPRARQGQFLGFSSVHSTTVGLIRNLRTGFISPQYHVVYDERFTTVGSSDDHIQSVEATWVDLFTTSRDNYLEGLEVDSSSIPTLDPSWTSSTGSTSLPSLPPSVRPVPVSDRPASDGLPTPRVLDFSDPSFDNNGPVRVPSPGDSPTDLPALPSPLMDETGRAPLRELRLSPPSQTPPSGRDRSPSPTHAPSKRLLKPNPKFFGDEWVNIARGDSYVFQSYFRPMSPASSFLSSIDWDSIDPIPDRFLMLMSPVNDSFYNVFMEHPMAFQLSSSLSDSPSLRDILRLPDGDERRGWFEAMDAEINALLDKSTFRLVPRAIATDRNKEIVGTTWVFKRKRKPDGTIIKLKARLVVRGDQQKQVGQDRSSTYSPVVAWSTVRLLFTLTTAFRLKSTQIDFRNAFVQSDLPEPIYIELPPGGYKTHPDNAGMILEVTKSLYGDRRAPQLWYKYLRQALEQLGFVMDKQDTCLYTKQGCVFVVYVDDAIIVSPNQSVIDDVITGLSDLGLDLERMGTMSDFLGVKINQLEDGALELTQPSLTERLIEVMGLSQAKPVSTPADGALGKCTTDPPATGDFNYRSAVGMAMFLTNNTRLDCAMSVHQCARYSSDPRLRHEQAMKRIGRYLLGTATNGLIIRPTDDLTLNCYVDADFCGLFSFEDADDPDSVRSRTGFVITLGEVPVFWSSKLQGSIALSTMEAEYVALSTAMRTLLPMKSVLKSMSSALNLSHGSILNPSIIFEDNEAALSLAITDPPRMTPRSKHIAIKYHWFRKHLKRGFIELQHIRSNDQKADMHFDQSFTKNQT
jgi:hypothetical protein